jgi:hypothetical protein
VAERTYTEADDGVRPDKEIWGKLEQRLYASWASRDVLYVKRAVPQLRVKTIAAQNDDDLPGIYIIEAIAPDGKHLQFKFAPRN